MADATIRIEIGFEGGQIMGALVTAESADQLERAFEAGSETVLELAAEDGAYHVALARVLYVKRFARESRVGFGGGAPR